MKKAIEQLCNFAFNFANMDTFFIDKESDIKLKFGYTEAPYSLSGYFSSAFEKLQFGEFETEYLVNFHTTSYHLHYISAKLYNEDQYLGSILVGPYLFEEPTMSMIESVISDNKMAISLKQIMKQYYMSLPMINTYKATLIGDFFLYLSSTWTYLDHSQEKGKLHYNFKDEQKLDFKQVKQTTQNAVEMLEVRYQLENAMLHAVETGNIELFRKKSEETSTFSSNILERIPTDPLRSRKNTGFVLNTLLRKAAEKGGVHPIYIDSISSKFAVQLEKCTTPQQLFNLFRSMPIEYCDAVRKLSLKDYTYPVRKAIEYIRINLNQDLSLDSISSTLSLNSYELSRQFKKDTGQTLTDYINHRRIKEAQYILENELISITDIAFMVGYHDVNYFTKVFKKLNGITPSEYRKKRE